MNLSAALVALVPPVGVVTVTSTVPEPAGDVAVMLVEAHHGDADGGVGAEVDGGSGREVGAGHGHRGPAGGRAEVALIPVTVGAAM